MSESEILEKLQGLLIEERIRVIEAILRSLKRDISLAPSRQAVAENRPLRGKVIRYDDPYDPVAADDWEATA